MQPIINMEFKNGPNDLENIIEKVGKTDNKPTRHFKMQLKTQLSPNRVKDKLTEAIYSP